MASIFIDDFNRRMGLGDTARLVPGEGDLPKLAVQTALAQAELYTHGAHVVAWQPQGHAPVLWMSRESRFAEGKPIRGGVPICFPWFGPKADDPGAPAHGLARTRTWDVSAIHRTADDDIVVELQAAVLDFALTYTVSVGRTLNLTLHVANTSAQPRTFEAALHTYLTIGDVRQARVTGLSGATYIDKVDGASRKVQGREPIMFTQETDRVYLGTEATCVVDDPVLLRRIAVEKSGSKTTVVWNPWIAKAARMEDFGDDEWPGMCCIETANAADDAITLPPRGDHAMTASIRVERRV